MDKELIDFVSDFNEDSEYIHLEYKTQGYVGVIEANLYLADTGNDGEYVINKALTRLVRTTSLLKNRAEFRLEQRVREHMIGVDRACKIHFGNDVNITYSFNFDYIEVWANGEYNEDSMDEFLQGVSDDFTYCFDIKCIY